jgi:hypothetical protein
MLTFAGARACALQGHPRTSSRTFIGVCVPIYTTDRSVVCIAGAVCSLSKTVQILYIRHIYFCIFCQIIFLLQKMGYQIDFKFLEKFDIFYSKANILLSIWYEGWMDNAACDYMISRQRLHCKKKVSDFSIASWDVTSQTLPGREFNYSRSGRDWLVTSQLGTGKSLTFFLQ